MLVIVYGTIGEMGQASRLYFEKHGFRMVEKLYSATDPQLTPLYTAREYISEEDFMARTDSLFRYEVGGIRVGCNQEQIDEAVYGEGNYFLTLAANADGFDMLEQIKKQQNSIKQAYENNVCLIYAYIDDTTLRRIVEKYPPEEREMRMHIGHAIKENYLAHQDLFNHVVIYGGEPPFDIDSLSRQYDSILAAYVEKESAPALQYGDVMIACAPEEYAIERRLREYLLEENIHVFDNRQLPQGEGYSAAVADAVRHAKVCIPVISAQTLETWREPMTALLKEASENGCLQVAVALDDTYETLYQDLFGYDYYQKSVIFGVDEERSDEALFTLASALSESIDYEAQVSAAARKAEAYRDVGEYETALYWQKEHLRLCRDIKFNDVYQLKEYFVGGPETAAASAIKAVRILLEMGNVSMAWNVLRGAVEFDSGCDYAETQGALVDELLRWCAQMNMNGQEVSDFLKELFFADLTAEDLSNHEDVVLWLEACTAQYEELLTKRSDPPIATITKTPIGAEQESIARHGEQVLALFEEMLQTCDNDLSRNDLLEGYQRLLNYCEHFRMGGAVMETCLDRLEALKTSAATEEGTLNAAQRALKLYLGDRPSAEGGYDVFLSFKSEDAVRATAVYDYLTRNGKRVFFSKKTLPQLGESEYEEAIFEAIENAKYMVLVSSDPNYLKTEWVREEWSTFTREIREGRKDGDVVLVLTDSIAADKGKLPTQLRKYEIVKMSEFRERLLSYLR